MFFAFNTSTSVYTESFLDTSVELFFKALTNSSQNDVSVVYRAIIFFKLRHHYSMAQNGTLKRRPLTEFFYIVGVSMLNGNSSYTTARKRLNS